jgi:hypothetical protein
MMAPCDLCYDLDLDRLAQRVLPHYDKSRSPTELGMGLQYLDASAAGGCKICDLLRRGLTFFYSEYGSRYEEYSHVTLALEITPQSLHGTIKVMSSPVVDVEFFAKPGQSWSISFYDAWNKNGLPG